MIRYRSIPFVYSISHLTHRRQPGRSGKCSHGNYTRIWMNTVLFIPHINYRNPPLPYLLHSWVLLATAGLHGWSLKKGRHFSQLSPSVLWVHSHRPCTCKIGSSHSSDPFNPFETTVMDWRYLLLRIEQLDHQWEYTKRRDHNKSTILSRRSHRWHSNTSLLSPSLITHLLVHSLPPFFLRTCNPIDHLQECAAWWNWIWYWWLEGGKKSHQSKDRLWRYEER